MSFELGMKKKYEDGYSFFSWKYRPIEDEKDGWEKVIAVSEALAEIADNITVDIEGPYANEKEYGDVGWKGPQKVEDLKGLLGALLKDGNYSGEIRLDIDEENVKVSFAIFKDSINFVVRGDFEKAKLVSTAIKKALEE